MNLKTFFLGCLMEGLPIKLVSIFQRQPHLLEQLQATDPELSSCIRSYLDDKDFVKLYRSASELEFSDLEKPAHLRDSSTGKLLVELADRYESLDPFNSSDCLRPSLASICDYLNPLKERATYVLKNRVHHWMYEEILRKREIKSLLEIGVFYGGSTHAWRVRLPECNLYSLDINYPLQDSRLLDRVSSLFTHGSSTDHLTLDEVCTRAPFDLIIDDASHIPSHQIGAFIYLVNKFALGGAYVVEDVHSADQDDHGFVRFVSLLAKYQENLDCQHFLSRTRELLCADTINLIDKIERSPLGIKKLERIHISRYGGNYVFTL